MSKLTPPIVLRAERPQSYRGRLELPPADARLTAELLEALVVWLGSFDYLADSVRLDMSGRTISWEVEPSQPHAQRDHLHAAVHLAIEKFLDEQVGLGLPADTAIVLVPPGYLGVPLTGIRRQGVCLIQPPQAYMTVDAFQMLRRRLLGERLVTDVSLHGDGYFICHLLPGPHDATSFRRVEQAMADCLGEIFPSRTFFVVPPLR